ncbi:MAG: prolyl oligopeptidase family serine peptidase, partial [Gemmatimonadota bacterium]
MRSRLLGALVLLALAPARGAGQRIPLTIERLVALPSLTGTTPASPAWSPDSRYLAFRWNDRGMPARDLWIVDRGGTTPRRLTSPDGDAAPAVSGFAWFPDEPSIAFLRSGDVWRIGVDGTAARRLSEDGGDKSSLAVSPDGRWVSYLRDGDLWFLPREGGAATRATSIGVPPIGTVSLGTYFRNDVEIGDATWGGDAPAYAWSPDSRTIALHVVDRRGVRRTAIPYYLGDSAILNVLRRPFPGDSNEVRQLALYDVTLRRLSMLALPSPSTRRIANVAWSPRGELLVDQESDDAIDRWLYLTGPGGTLRLIWHDHRTSRIYNAIASTWHPDGRRVVITGDLDDRYRLYALTPGDSLPRPLTPATSDVDGAAIAVPATRQLYYTSTDPDPANRQIWRLGASGAPVRLTDRPGIHTPLPSPDGTSLAFLHTDDITPLELYLGSAATPRAAHRITTSPSADFAAQPWVRARYVTFPSRTAGVTLHARILEPPGLDSTQRYPVLFGPVYSNTVRNRWAGLYASVQQMLAIELGFIVVQVDVRGSTGYGRAFREQFLMDWGGGDLDDLEDAVNHMKALPYVDGDRIGIWGSSYGGTLTVYSLLKKPGLFRAGVAGAPATDPHYFGSDDVAIVRRPQTHPDAFLRGARQYAAQLQDHLLIIHGMEDDVVPFQTTVALAEELMRQGKDFDVAFAPAATHGWTQRPYYARYLLQRLVDHFVRYLGRGPAD